MLLKILRTLSKPLNSEFYINNKVKNIKKPKDKLQAFFIQQMHAVYTLNLDLTIKKYNLNKTACTDLYFWYQQ